jgi:hypothetical protein
VVAESKPRVDLDLLAGVVGGSGRATDLGVAQDVVDDASVLDVLVARLQEHRCLRLEADVEPNWPSLSFTTTRWRGVGVVVMSRRRGPTASSV